MRMNSEKFGNTGLVPFEQIQGYMPGRIPAYSNKHDHYFSAERHIERNIFFGFKYQCVEFARRALYLRKGLLLPNVDTASNIVHLTHVHDVQTAQTIPLRFIPNGSPEKPVEDSLFISPATEKNPFGHVGVISEVGDDYVGIADQNCVFYKWEGPYGYKLKLTHENGLWTIHDDIGVLGFDIPAGWVTFPGVANLEEGSEPLPVHESLWFPKPPALSFERVSINAKSKKFDCLDLNSPAEKLFVEEFGIDVTRSCKSETKVSYYDMNSELYLRTVAYANQVHAIFLEATGMVIADDEKLRLFHIPEEFWPQLRHSWEHHRESITGRFDFAFNSTQGLKCFEYNADSASTLLECGRIQKKWKQSVGVDLSNSRSAGYWMDRNLQMAWMESGVKGCVHFCVDNDHEEMYTALYCMEAANAVGLKGKLCVLFDEFHFDDAGRIVDHEGVAVRYIWKTWMWESAIADYYDAKKTRGENWTPRPDDKVRLCDLLLGKDWTIKVFEPMWKLIPSNKAILPLIYQLYPEHPAILRAAYELTDDLRRAGYAKKPIVGRVGRNVTLANTDGHIKAASSGNYGERDMIYQELFNIPEQDGYYAILGVWIIGDMHGGIGVREDKTLITGLDSPFAAVCLNFGSSTNSKDTSRSSVVAEDD
ncbi:unnamed protein product [Phytomonas sp. Hart1]|nr:unnamed protein product [Phytomonas sp. Hart1]|eukprot:CCW70499.1 unnamed protein product [Phytomonas sp. isolate Hart1]